MTFTALLRAYQLDIMLFMSGICAILAFMTLMTESLSQRRKSILALMELSAMLLLLFERFSYLYRGDASELGFLMVRFSNGMVFFMQIFIPHLVTQYMKDMLKNDASPSVRIAIAATTSTSVNMRRRALTVPPPARRSASARSAARSRKSVRNY